MSLDDIGTSTERAVLIKIKNVPAVITKQGGSAGALAQGVGSFAKGLGSSAINATLEGKVYDTVAAQLHDKFKEQGVDADVQVVEPAGYQAAGASPIWKPIALGLGGVGVLVLGWKLVARFRR